jgi:hypothetical protein
MLLLLQVRIVALSSTSLITGVGRVLPQTLAKIRWRPASKGGLHLLEILGIFRVEVIGATEVFRGYCAEYTGGGKILQLSDLTIYRVPGCSENTGAGEWD